MRKLLIFLISAAPFALSFASDTDLTLQSAAEERAALIRKAAELKAEYIRKDPEFKKLHERIMELQKELTLRLDTKQEIRDINTRLLQLDEIIKGQNKK